MENLSPSLKFVLSFRYGLESGKSLQVILREYFQNVRDELSGFLIRWHAAFEKGEFLEPSQHLKSPSQIALVHLLHSGLKGNSIYSSLMQMEVEIIDRCRDEVVHYATKLAFRLLIPLICFQFPALLILFLGALVSQLERSM